MTVQTDLYPFTIVLKEKSEVQERDGSIGYKLVVAGKATFGSPNDMPTNLFGCTKADGDRMTVGNSYAAILLRGKKNDKYDGSAHWHYSWRFVGLNPNAPGQQQPPPQAAPPRPQAQPGAVAAAIANIFPPVAPVVPAPTVPTPPAPLNTSLRQTALIQANLATQWLLGNAMLRSDLEQMTLPAVGEMYQKLVGNFFERYAATLDGTLEQPEDDWGAGAAPAGMP